jgi:outer membrane protein assembly factor BamB
MNPMTDPRHDPLAVPPGEWHMYRRDHRLHGRAPLAGAITTPTIRWSFPLGGSENECFPVPAADGRMDLLFAFGGCVIRTDGTGTVLWKSRSYGINAIGAVADLDGDGTMEIACSTGYEVIVLAAESGTLLMRHDVGFPRSSGTPAGTILCHQFDKTSRGMHLIAPMMSAKEVLVFDFRNGNRNGTLTHTLWMDDAFHPTAVAADMDNDGVDELVISKLSGLYVFNVLTGAMLSSVTWTSNGERHRNYGLHQLIDIDGDGVREVVIVAERVARHIAVIDNDGKGKLTPLWDRFVEFIYPSDTTELRHVGNSVADVDGDGKPELIVCLFNDRKDERWWLEIIDPLTGAVKMALPDTYLWGVQDVNADGTPELLIGKEYHRNPAPYGTVEVVSVRGLSTTSLWRCENARFAGKALRPSGWSSNFRPVHFAHDETWSERSGTGSTLFLFTRAADRSQSFAAVTWDREKVSVRSSPLQTTGEIVMVALADVNGDGTDESILSENNGRILVLRPGTGILSQWTAGFRLQLEGFSAARPGPVPVVYRIPGDATPFIVVPDNTNTFHQIQVTAGGSAVTELWQRPGRGCMGYDNCFHSAYIHDVNGDGVPEIMISNTQRPDCSELLALDTTGTVKLSWTFPDAPPAGMTRIGLYQWIVVDGDAGKTIVASWYASYSMNSEQTTAIGLGGQQLWHRREQGEGEWGRGVGPWSAFSVALMPGTDTEVMFLAKDLLCRVNARTGEWIREPWLLWHATNSVMNQPDWEFTKDRQADFGTARDPFTAYGSAILADMDNDGREEMLIGGCFGGFGLLRDDFSIVWWMQAPFTDMMLRLPGIANVHGDGRLCVGLCRANGVFHCLDGATGATLWEIDLHSTTSDIVSCDIDGDGKEEFIVGTTDGRLLAIGTDAAGRGVIRWSLTIGTALGSPVVADVDGDGSSEILVVTGDGSLVCIGSGD